MTIPAGRASLGGLPLELITHIIGILQDDHVALICLSLTSHRFHDLVTSFIDSLHDMSLYDLCIGPRRCPRCYYKSQTTIYWMSDVRAVRFNCNPRTLLAVAYGLVHILENRWGHYHYDWEELMRLLRRDSAELLP